MAEPAYEQQEVPHAVLRERMAGIIAALDQEAADRVAKRDIIEQRWLEDLRQYHGLYDPDTETKLKTAKTSRLFINQTRQKTNACEARLSDMLFPTDDRNFGIQPTPVPELNHEADAAARAAIDAQKAAAEDPENPQLQQNLKAAEAAAGELYIRMEEARRRAALMEDEIDDQFRECNYSVQARRAIRDGCKLGTGILKGPMAGERARRSWRRAESGGYQMASVADNRPSFWRVDPWNFFPDMDGATMAECEGVFERHLMNKKEVRALQRRPGFYPEGLLRVLKMEPNRSSPSYLAHLRSITGAYHDSGTDRYHIWEYHGPLELADMRIIAGALGDDALLADLDEMDELAEHEFVIWFCQGEVLKCGIHQLDSGESIYSVWNLEKDEASLFGFGIPYLMRDSQKALNGGWRAMMDNGGLGSGPQIVVNPDVVEPMDNDWTIRSRKLWRRKSAVDPNAKVFETFDIPIHQRELAGIIEMAMQFIDDETAVPTLAQGEQGSHVTQTAHGMSILMNSVNVVFRRIVKNWDDDMTTPNVRRSYDWNMQFSPKDYLKGDYEVVALGTSVLLVKEMQSANLLSFVMNFSGHPLLGKYLKDEGLPAMRRLAQTMMLVSDEVIKSDQEIRADKVEARNQPPTPDPEIMKLEAQYNIAQMTNETKLMVAQYERETALLQLAAKNNLELDKVRALLLEGQAERDSKERIMAAEIAEERRKDARGDSSGSGGYV